MFILNVTNDAVHVICKKKNNFFFCSQFIWCILFRSVRRSFGKYFMVQTFIIFFLSFVFILNKRIPDTRNLHSTNRSAMSTTDSMKIAFYFFFACVHFAPGKFRCRTAWQHQSLKVNALNPFFFFFIFLSVFWYEICIKWKAHVL